MVRTEGIFQDGLARGEWEIVEGSGLGDLMGLFGEGRFEATHEGGGATAELSWSLESS